MLLRPFAIVAAADLVAKVALLAASPLLAMLLPIEKFGAIAWLQALWGAVMVIQFLGADTALPILLSRTSLSSGSDASELTRTTTIIAVIGCLAIPILTAALLFLLPTVNALQDISYTELTLFFLGVSGASVAAWCAYSMRYMQKHNSFAKLTIAGKAVPIGVGVVVAFFFVPSESLTAYLVGFAIAAWLAAMLGLFYQRPHIGAIGFHPLPDRQLTKRVLLTGAVGVPAWGAYGLMLNADRLLGGYYLGSVYVAQLSVAALLGSIPLLLKVWFLLLWEPEFLRRFRQDSAANWAPFVATSVQLLCISATAFAVGILVWQDLVIGALYPAEFELAATLVPLYLWGSTLSILASIASSVVLYVTGEVRNALIANAVALLVAIAVIFGTVPKLGAWSFPLGFCAGEAVIGLFWYSLGANRRIESLLRFRSLIIAVGTITICVGASVQGYIAFEEFDLAHRAVLSAVIVMAALVLSYATFKRSFLGGRRPIG